MKEDQLLSFSLADFHYNDNPDVLQPPEDFKQWLSHSKVRSAFSFFEQQLLTAPKAKSRVRNNFDGKERDIINLTSYNYLGLSTHPEVIQACKETLDKYGMGASGAPLLSGTFDLHAELADKLAAFKEKEGCLLYSSGFGGNVGAIQGILRKGDIAIMDEKIHRSIVDGVTLSGAKMAFFPHNNMKGLEALLEKHQGKRKLVLVEGVYSMDGDLVKLPEVSALCESYNAGLFLDEAHSSLIFGEHGRGVGEHFGLEDKVGVSFGTLSKSFGGVGGFICSNQGLIDYLKGYSSPWNFSCAIAPPIVGGLLKALEVATRDSTLRDKLWQNTHYFRKGLEALNLNLGLAESQVIPIIIGSSGDMLLEMASQVQARGLFLQPVDYPAVPAHERRFRISVSSQLNKEEIDQALNIIEDVIAKGLGTVGK
ncbi:pyridoxal phosphate-dependent aminotransferase family protein [Candidatus Haliotispira prima]|uniref:Pyridoxal phosphate-dependent aminotransferase family protein n=1 Tax=Candidatus Haliotispira prima TaxID=3034016 RepID=A0ABY8MF70_9SPIO|nr:pyridoxal phosphate-dependent aminotransferase family protein [Candidatus Haliotispira prima]